MSQRGELRMEEMRELLDRISDSGIEVPQTVREAMCGLHLDQFTTYDFDGFFTTVRLFLWNLITAVSRLYLHRI